MTRSELGTAWTCSRRGAIAGGSTTSRRTAPPRNGFRNGRGPVKILLACAQSPPTISGYSQVAGHLADGFRDSGHEVELVTEGHGCYRRGRAVWLDATGRALLARGADVVQVIGPSPPFTEQVARCAHRLGLPVVYYVHAFAGMQTYRSGTVYRLIDSLYTNTYYRRALRGVTHATSSTTEFARQCRSYAGLWTVIPNGVDDPCLRAGSMPAAEAASDPDRELQILFVGQLRPYKAVDGLLRALERNVRAGHPARLTIVGDGPERPNWENLARELRLGERVEFRGSLSSADLHSEYLVNDVLALPSVGGESFGIVLLEARLHGLDIIASDLPGVRELVLSIGGNLVPPRAVESLALALARERPLPPERRVLSKTIAETYTWPAVVTRYLELYRSLLDQTGR